MVMELKKDKEDVFIYFGNAAHKIEDAPKEAITPDFRDNPFLQQLKELYAGGVRTIIGKLYPETRFSSLLAAEIFFSSQKIKEAGLNFDTSGFPQNIRDLLSLASQSQNILAQANKEEKPFLVRLGEISYSCFESTKNALLFTHEAFVSIIRFVSGRAVFRSKDFFMIFADCSYKAIGIIALASFLVGLILAFVGALQLRTFGAGIYVASMVALGMTRIMAAIMTGIIMAGRTGSSFAATLGTMQVNEEIDALKTLGIRVTDYLAAPRIVSLVISIPFLTMLADFLGIMGGAAVGVGFLKLSASSYFEYSLKALSLNNILVGLLHSVIYGFIISLSGCYAGLYAGRDADSVGKATTKAVVTALVGMIVATGILTVILEELGI